MSAARQDSTFNLQAFGTESETSHWQGADFSSDRGAMDAEQARGLKQKNLVNSCPQVRDNEVVMPRTIPLRPKEKGGAARHMGRLCILPLITHHKGTFQIEMPFKSSLREKTGFRFATTAIIICVVWT